ncbi:MAG: sigma-54-dependent transcriptional regulator [Bacteroidota bacterium]
MTNSDFHILIVDDEESQREILAGFLKKKRYDVHHSGSAREALAKIRKNRFDLVLSDYRMPEKTGFDLLQEIKSINPETDVVLMTAFGTIEGAVAAMREGAFDYISKPIELDELELLIRRLQERRQLISENKLLKEQLSRRYSFEGIISQSSAMQEVLNTAARVAETNAPVLIRGESGTGKEVIAHVIHYNSQRKDKPFIAVNCAALNENLLESELFGHEKGAYTGAEKQRRGRFELADSGTIFLDEIGDISPATQVRLLRVLQEQTFERVGGTETIEVNVRVIAATNKNLEQAIENGSFREDLFYRLNVITIDIPPLRNRRDDIPPLLEHFVSVFAKEHKRKKLTFSKEAWDTLVRYDYPGNVRELENIMQRAVIFSRGEHITREDLPLNVRPAAAESTLPAEPKDLQQQVDRLEKELIFDALRMYGNNQTKAAKQLGLTERNLRYKLKKWGMK